MGLHEAMVGLERRSTHHMSKAEEQPQYHFLPSGNVNTEEGEITKQVMEAT